MIRIIGDANGDGYVTEEDAILVARHAIFGSESYPVTPEADVDGDGMVTFDDSEAIRDMVKSIPGGMDGDYPVTHEDVATVAVPFAIMGIIFYAVARILDIWR